MERDQLRLQDYWGSVFGSFWFDDHVEDYVLFLVPVRVQVSEEEGSARDRRGCDFLVAGWKCIPHEEKLSGVESSSGHHKGSSVQDVFVLSEGEEGKEGVNSLFQKAWVRGYGTSSSMVKVPKVAKESAKKN